jgi:tetratricopeptide (TPR) repeat protein
MALVAAVLLGIAAPARADYWYEHYARAESALEAEEWSRAVQELQEALERKGDSGARVRSYGMKVIAYFPYLKLGIAYYHLGQVEAALQAFQTEQQLGAIQASESDLAELERYRRLALRAQQQAAQREADRIAQIVRESLAEAQILERQGRLPAAMEALGKGLAVDPSNSDAVAMMDRLRTAAVELERRQEDEARVADLVARGRALLGDEEYAEASSLFRQALSVRPDTEAEELLARAQEGLRAQVRSDRDAREQRQVVASRVAEARDLEAAGRLSEALDRLQPVLASDPDNTDGVELQERILRVQRDTVRRDSVARALADAESELTVGRFEGAISAANRALAIDPGNAAALEYVRSAYREISRRLLGSQTIENIPPAIRFADLRQDQDDGSRLQVVRSPDFRLNGVIIDNSPVDVRFLGPADREVEGTSASQPVGEYYVTEFSLSDILAEGPSTYRLVATDSAGLSSSSEYMVVYTPPFFRSPWFIVTLVAVPIGVVAGAWARRARRRRRLVSRRFNPYIAGAPVLDRRLFFGRDQLVERILQTIHNNSLLLYGERRIGKTSLQHHLKRRLQRLEDPVYDFHPVYVDLQGTPEERFFATLAEDVFGELGPVLGDLTPSAELDSGYGYRELVRDLRNVIKTLEASSSKRIKLVLLIDEVDELNDYDPRINQRLRSLFMKSFAENLVAVVSGVEIRKQWEKEGSPWYNFFEEIEVTAIGRDDAEALIRRPVQDVFKFDHGVVDRIIELTDSKPYAIQRFCVALVNRLHELDRRTITVADVEAVDRAREP